MRSIAAASSGPSRSGTARNPLPAIDELVSTILSQNTNDINRDRAFNALRAKFKTWEDVRDANPTDVVDAIRPAGLANQKGPRIQQVLRSITEERGDLDLSFLAQLPVPEAKAWLTKFNGVGPKTAAIVLCFSLNMPAFPVDTHVQRVTRRLGWAPRWRFEETFRRTVEWYRAFHAGAGKDALAALCRTQIREYLES